MELVRSTDGTAIAFDRIGSTGIGYGRPLVIIGGGPTTREVNKELAVRLAVDRQVLNYDRRGHGDSADGPYTVERELEDLAAVIDAAGGRADLLGSSGGAVVALEAAMRGLPVDRLVLWEPAYVIAVDRPPVPANYRDDLLRLLAAGDREGALLHFFRSAVALPDEFIAMMPSMPGWAEMVAIASTLANDAELLGDFSVPVGRLPAVTLPTLVLDGATTGWLTATADAVNSALPLSRRQTLNGQLHNVDPAVLAPAAADFLDGAS